MRRKLICSILLSAIFVLPATCKSNFSVTTNQPVTPQYTQYQYPQYNQYSNIPTTTLSTESISSNTQPLKGYVVVVPQGASMEVLTTSEISSATATLGQSISMALPNGYYYNNVLVAPAGSTVTGNVIDVKKSTRAGINGKLKLRFTSIVTPYGQIIPISAMVKTTDGSGLLVCGTAKDSAKEYAKDITIGAGSGAALGTAMGALSRGSVGQGAIYGTAIGGGIGLIKSLWHKGIDVTIPANANLELIIDQPVTVPSAN